MKKSLGALIALCLCATLLTAQAQTSSPSPKSSKNTPGEEIAHTISLVTGVAISPLLGVSAVGAWQYFHAKTDEQKAKLHWYSNPLFWVPALILVIACFVKDTAGTALPTALKKPLDIAESIEHKISGLVATGAFIPLAVSIFENNSSDGASLSSLGLAAIDLSWLYNGIMIPISMIAFFFVFLASNAINILILLSPFTTVDMALKGFRGTVLASVALSAWANPWIGAAWAIIIILFAYLIAGWSFRLSHCGIVFIWDVVTMRHKWFVPDKTTNKIFLARKIDKVPARTYGKLSRDEKGNFVLQYRPWLVLPVRTLVLPEGKYEIGRGFFYSEILKVEGEEARTLIFLPPRYVGHEDELAEVCGPIGVRDVGIRAAWAWFKGLFGGKIQTAQA